MKSAAKRSSGAPPAGAEPAARQGARSGAASRTSRGKPAPRGGARMEPLALLERIASGEFPTTVYLDGPDEAVKAAFLAEFRRMWAAAVPEAPHARVLRPDEQDVDEILASYQNVSLFAPRELTIVFQMEKLGRSEKKVAALADGLARPAGGSCLILVEAEAETARKTLEPLRAACAVRVEAQPPQPSALLEWGRRRLAAAQASAEPGALEALLATCEQDALAFMNEVGKLAVLAGATGVVTRAHVQSLIAPRVGANIPDYLHAVASLDAGKAAQQLERVLAAGENEGSVLWALGHLVSSALAVRANPYGWARWKPLTLMLSERRNPDELARALDAVYRAEAAWKAGRVDALSALEQATREVAAR